MSEFKKRLDVQRQVIELVNLKNWPSEQLHGLSSAAIERWALKNHQSVRNDLKDIISSISEELLFLATKSQDQISTSYEVVMQNVFNKVELLKKVLR